MQKVNYTMRDYQARCSDSIFELWKVYHSVLAVLATGLGKTILAADVVRRMHPKRTMFIAHREELIFQAANKINAVTGLGCEIEMADLVASTSLFHQQDVVVSTVQTQTSGNRMERFNPEEFGLLIVDEVHHSTAKSYRKVIDHYRKNPNLKVLGITATPDRTDEEALGQIFSKVAMNFGILEGIENGWLVPVSQQLVKIQDLDFSHVRTTAGDLNGADLAKVMEEEKTMQGVAGASMDIIGDRRAIVFTASVKQAETVCEIFNRRKAASSDWICGATEKQSRRDSLDRFSKGEIQIMCNCACLTEGFDDPGVEVIIMAKPTKSRSLYTQMCGRGTRPLAGVVDGPPTVGERITAILQSKKPSCLIVDFTGNSGRHKLITMADVLGGNKSEEVRARAKKDMEKSGAAIPVQQALEQAEADLRREEEEKEERDRRRRARLVARVDYSSRQIDPFNRHDTDTYQAEISKDGRSFTEKQTARLRKAGINPTAVSFAQGQAIIGKIMSNPTDPQMKVLLRAGYTREELAGVPVYKASKMIDACKANGWKRPVAPTNGGSVATSDMSDAELAEYTR